jgi:nucleotidyltransferase substrate binding protein (TIGR01987 family)
MMPFDPSPLVNATARLHEGLTRYERDTADEQIRDGLIQRFEFTYELCHRMLRRYLREVAASPDEVDRMGFADLIRAGNAAGLLRGDWVDWRRYCDMRARTSHAYDVRVALEVVAGIPGFVSEAQYFCDALVLRMA